MADVKSTKPTRRYHSPVREENARRTRRALVAAATKLFVANGYTATSLADVAAAAGVARPTVTAAFGTKPALLRQVLDEALAGDDAPVPVAERPWYRPVREADTQSGVIDAYADVCMLIGGRTAAIFETVRRAADTGPEVGEVWATLLRNRRFGAYAVVERLRSLGDPLRQGDDVERAADVVWFFNDPAHYAALVLHAGWTPEEFRAWLATQMRAALLTG
ncbi:TetR/AcrR family transcriptional regulator [Micromonospora endolithica]|uniref:TetR family transcriptional regulator n=1 Tax=Micromonospora endolithica TaxID=230091 RepID=A0A3A9ZTS8_9ACTN|nr:TetR family transcriptional regulator [Micromonospora endolithica]RKN50877.1 TetR family transcriptional regulator [Micromonospora endolithica]TWJ20354.1 TetR family transcriptional regulator [Micromonospora endolithica]